MPQPLKTFIIYARKDESFKNDLMLHLKGSLIATGHLEVWHDGLIAPGEEWQKKIEENLVASDLFLVLLSIHSLTSDFIQKKELVKALDKKSRIVPIVVRSCFWKNHPIFAGLQGLPKDMKPVSSYTDHDDAWTEVMTKLHEMVEDIWNPKELQPVAALKPAPTVVKVTVQERPLWLPEMVTVKGGTYQMGDEKGDLWEGCRPVHTVTVSDFEIGKYPVTQKEWIAIMGNNPSHFKGDRLPIENVSWNDCLVYLKKLNEKTGRNFRLPTEAEWEFAARGGNATKGKLYAGSDEVEEVAWYAQNSDKSTHPVGQKKANELGIFDMSGNVWEWCSDWYEKYPSDSQNNPGGQDKGSSRVYRGGSWISNAEGCRVSNRDTVYPDFRHFNIGFRVTSLHK